VSPAAREVNGTPARNSWATCARRSSRASAAATRASGPDDVALDGEREGVPEEGVRGDDDGADDDAARDDDEADDADGTAVPDEHAVSTPQSTATAAARVLDVMTAS
jgi:hypothetical protein